MTDLWTRQAFEKADQLQQQQQQRVDVPVSQETSVRGCGPASIGAAGSDKARHAGAAPKRAVPPLHTDR